jgi:hypothetical protein
MDGLTSVVVGLNAVANCLGQVLFPISLLSGWLSVTLVAIATGPLMMLLFKATSNQLAIQRVRRSIRANLLAVTLFRDSVAVGLLSQGRVLLGALRLLLLALVPLLVMIVPTVLLIAQLGLWYQARPLRVGQETVVSVKLSGEAGTSWPTVQLKPCAAVEDLSGPVRVSSQREVCWTIRARQAGYHVLTFCVGGHTFEKEVAIGSRVLCVSVSRPEWDWYSVLLNPREAPFDRASAVQSIRIEYADRPGWMTGTDAWVIYWLVVSLVSGFLFKGVLGVHL